MLKRDQFEVKKRCSLCMWDSRDHAQHYTQKDWPLQEELVPCKEKNVINDPLVGGDRILFPPLHIKLGLSNSPRLWTRMVTASLTCAMLFQD